jgi:hypothetical protein
MIDGDSAGVDARIDALHNECERPKIVAPALDEAVCNLRSHVEQ